VGRLLALVAHLGGLVLLVVGVAELGVAVEGDLGVEGVDLAVGLRISGLISVRSASPSV
jgi:hypothetical protein